MDQEKLDQIAGLAEKATPGPWAWFHSKVETYLATTNRGRRFVMQFARKGMRDAQPVFQVYEGHGHGVMVTAVEIGDEAALRAHPDASFIAACDPSTIQRLITAARRARAMEEALRKLAESDHDYDCMTNIGNPVTNLDRCDCFRSVARAALAPPKEEL